MKQKSGGEVRFGEVVFMGKGRSMIEVVEGNGFRDVDRSTEELREKNIREGDLVQITLRRSCLRGVVESEIEGRGVLVV